MYKNFIIKLESNYTYQTFSRILCHSVFQYNQALLLNRPITVIRYFKSVISAARISSKWHSFSNPATHLYTTITSNSKSSLQI